MKVFCIIPGRYDSRRLEHKTWKSLEGVPLIRRAVELAIKSKYIQDIVISTDTSKVHDIARTECTIENTKEIRCRIRPPDLCDPKVNVFPLVTDVITSLNRWDWDMVVVLQLDHPLTTVGDIDRSIEILMENPDKDVVVSVHRKIGYVVQNGAIRTCKIPCLKLGPMEQIFIGMYLQRPFVDIHTQRDFDKAEILIQLGNVGV